MNNVMWAVKGPLSPVGSYSDGLFLQESAMTEEIYLKLKDTMFGSGKFLLPKWRVLKQMRIAFTERLRNS
jgi:hypothetical protein